MVRLNNIRSQINFADNNLKNHIKQPIHHTLFQNFFSSLFILCNVNWMLLTFGVERNETITEWPVLHRLIENDFLLKRDHCDVFKQTQSLQDLLHRLRLGLLRHGTDTHHDLSLWGLEGPQFKHLKHLIYTHRILKERVYPKIKPSVPSKLHGHGHSFYCALRVRLHQD